MNILLAGTPHTTMMIADAVVGAGHSIVGVLCPFPKPVGRKKVVTACELELWARSRSIPVFNVDKEALSKGISHFALPKTDVLVVADFGYLIPAWLLGFPTYGAYNLHPSLLPRWRGATPVPFTLLFGDTETGISIIKMNEKFDLGDVVAQVHIEVVEGDTTPTLLDRCFAQGAEVLVTVLPHIEQGKTVAIPQPPTSSTPMTRKFTKDDGFVPIEALRAAMEGKSFEGVKVRLLDEFGLPHSPIQIDHMVRALTPWPGVWTMKEGKRVIVMQCSLQGTKISSINVKIEGDNFPVQKTKF